MRKLDFNCDSVGDHAGADGTAVFRRRLCAPLIAVILATAWQGAQAATLEPRTAGQVTYLCGGIGQDEQQAIRAQSRNFDRGLLFTQGPRGSYLAGVDVRLSRNGEEIASFKADGPRCLIKGPDGTYQVNATYNGVERRTNLAQGQRNVQLRW